MFKYRYFITITLFVLMLILVSFIKNQTRIIEKNINKLTIEISKIKKEIYTSQIDFSYLSSPYLLKKEIYFLFGEDYKPIEFSKIYIGLENFLSENYKTSKNLERSEKKIKK